MHVEILLDDGQAYVMVSGTKPNVATVMSTLREKLEDYTMRINGILYRRGKEVKDALDKLERGLL